jgi:serine/threonine protein kinase
MSRGVRYRVLRKLAHGGMAEIFLALQVGAEGFEKPVVLKRILPALSADPAFVRMLVDEAHIVSTLNHSNLVQVLDLGQAGSEFFLVLEFVDGWSLEQVRRRAIQARTKLPLSLSLYIVSSLCRALDYVHRRTRNGESLGIVHRDVTPQNVLISSEGEVKLADFGIAKAVGKREKSSTGVIKGKFAYMSPEQAIGAELDARSDLFSVGTLLYILTTGKKPFDAPTDLEVLMQVRRARFEKPSTLVPDFDPDVERFLARALRSERSKRFQSAEQMAERIDKILVKLGQPTGPSALKRWLDALSARDGVLPPGEARDAPVELPASTMELGSAELELRDVAPSRFASRAGTRASAGSDEDGLHEDFSNARTEFAFAEDALVEEPPDVPQRSVEARGSAPEPNQDAATAVARPGYPEADSTDAEPERHTITIVVPSGATVIGLIPGDDQVKLRHEGVARETCDLEARESACEQDKEDAESGESAEPAAEQTRQYEPQLTAAGVERETFPDLSSKMEVPWLASGAAARAAPERGPSGAVLLVVDDEELSAHTPARGRRLRVATLLSLVLFGGGLFAARPYFPGEFVPAEVVELVERWMAELEGLPRALRDAGARLDFPTNQE